MLIPVISCNNGNTGFRKADKLVSSPSKAYNEILTARDFIQLAEKGTISKTEAIEQFNNSIGLVTGKLYSFSKVKTFVYDSAAVYLQRMQEKKAD